MTGPPGDAPILRIRGLVKDFGGLRAVDRCDLDVPRGTVTGLIGPNGAGKTTLFSLVSGFVRPDAGTVTFDGEDVTGLPPHEIFRKGLCRTFQIPREHGSMTVLENLMLVPKDQIGERFWGPLLRPGAVARQEREIGDRAREVLAFLRLEHLADDHARSLSGGQKKLLEIARTLMAEPKLVLLDEPAAGVNPALMEDVRTRIEELQSERGITFLLIEHNMSLVMDLCDPVVVMNEGRDLAVGSPDEVRRDPKVLDAYLGGEHADPRD